MHTYMPMINRGDLRPDGDRSTSRRAHMSHCRALPCHMHATISLRSRLTSLSFCAELAMHISWLRPESAQLVAASSNGRNHQQGLQMS